MIHIRPAADEDTLALARIDAATSTVDVSPGPAPTDDRTFFTDRLRPEDVLVAEVDGVVAGFAVLGRSTAMPSHEHVLVLNGLAVDPTCRGKGAGRHLVEAAIQEARVRGARKLSLRVLGTNPGAQRLYAACGFVAEGLLLSEFFLAGRYVDDVLMARHLDAQQ